MDYKVGDEVWYIPNGYDILIKCVITEVDDFARRLHPDKTDPLPYLFYWLDEPVGHGLAEWELYSSFEEAWADFQTNVEDEEYDEDFPYEVVTLEYFRKSVIKFVHSTWGEGQEEEKDADVLVWYDELPSKIQGVDWFNAFNL